MVVYLSLDCDLVNALECSLIQVSLETDLVFCSLDGLSLEFHHVEQLLLDQIHSDHNGLFVSDLWLQ